MGIYSGKGDSKNLEGFNVIKWIAVLVAQKVEVEVGEAGG